jgi:NTP pyrophosphatase (non-canonical NTP hydrolase)
MNSREKEILCILQEECAEVTQAISKIFRFGIDNHKPDQDKTNRQHLEEELGDLQCMINLLIESGMVSENNIMKAEIKKHAKLEKWSTVTH